MLIGWRQCSGGSGEAAANLVLLLIGWCLVSISLWWHNLSLKHARSALDTFRPLKPPGPWTTCLHAAVQASQAAQHKHARLLMGAATSTARIWRPGLTPVPAGAGPPLTVCT